MEQNERCRNHTHTKDGLERNSQKRGGLIEVSESSLTMQVVHQMAPLNVGIVFIDTKSEGRFQAFFQNARKETSGKLTNE